MKSLIIFAAFLTLSVTAMAQCKFKTNEADPFTSEKHLVSKDIRLNGDMKSANEAKFYAITNLEMTGSVIKWNFKFYELTIRDKNSLESITLRIKTKNGVLEVASKSIPDPIYSIDQYLKMTELDFHFELSADQLKSLASGVELVGLAIFGENKLFKDKDLSEVTEYAGCMLK